MGSSISSHEGGSLKSVSEVFAFPHTVANKYHVPTHLNVYDGVNYGIINELMVNKNGVIIFCHGNCMTVDINTMSVMQQFSDDVSAPIYMVEYHGYGESADNGKPTAESCIESLAKIVDCVSQQYNDKDIYLMGHSIGTGVVAQYVHQNKEREFGGMILLAPYKSILSVVVKNEMLEYTSSSVNFYKTQDVISEIKIPQLLIHGKLDNVIDFKHSEALAERNDMIKLHVLTGVDHNNILDSMESMYLVENFIKK